MFWVCITVLMAFLTGYLLAKPADNTTYYDIPLSDNLQRYTNKLCNDSNLSYELELAVLCNTVGYENVDKEIILNSINKIIQYRYQGMKRGLSDEDNYFFILLAYDMGIKKADEALKNNQDIYTDFVENVSQTKFDLELMIK